MRSFSLVARKSIMPFMAVLVVCGSANTFAAVSSDRISGAQMKQRINSFPCGAEFSGQACYFRQKIIPGL